MSARWTEYDLQAYLAKNNPRAAVRASNVESPLTAQGGAANHINQMDQRVCIHIHSRRRRLTDPDAISAKAAIDGLRKGGLLVNDTTRYVEAVTFSQEKWFEDETIIEIEEIG